MANTLQADRMGRQVRADYTMDQPTDEYTPEDHAIWRTLFERQAKILPGRACPEYLAGLNQLGVAAGGVPNFEQLSDIMEKATGWRIVCVQGLVPDQVFFEHLANRRFPVSWWIRRRDQMDYLQEPDIFHDIYGHVPLLVNPIFGDYMAAFGEGGLKAIKCGALAELARLYWYTVEFGLINTAEGLRIYGAGIMSSKSESIYCLENQAPNRIGFDLTRLMRTKYRIDTYQKTYFVIDSFEQLFEATGPDFTPIYNELKGLPAFGSGDVLATDRVYHRGTGEGWEFSSDAG